MTETSQGINWTEIEIRAKQSGWRRTRNPLLMIADLFANRDRLTKVVDLGQGTLHKGIIVRRGRGDQGMLVVTYGNRGSGSIEAVGIISSKADQSEETVVSATAMISSRRGQNQVDFQIAHFTPTGQLGGILVHTKISSEAVDESNEQIQTDMHAFVGRSGDKLKLAKPFGIDNPSTDRIDFQGTADALVDNLINRYPQRPISKLAFRRQIQ